MVVEYSNSKKMHSLYCAIKSKGKELMFHEFENNTYSLNDYAIIKTELYEYNNKVYYCEHRNDSLERLMRFE